MADSADSNKSQKKELKELEDTELTEDIADEEQQKEEEISVPKTKIKVPKNSTKLYFKEIREAPLLEREEEIALARRVKKGDEKARKQMIESNLRLVVTISRKYLNCGLDLADLIEEGNFGLMHAVKKFDPEKGFRFSTYATYWIRHHIERAIMNQGRTVRLPIHIIRELSAYRRKAMKLHKRLEHQATDQELADLIDQPLERVRKILSFGGETLSLDTPVFLDEGGASFVDNLEDETQLDPVTTLEDEDLKILMNELINELDKQQYEVLSRRFGFETGERMTLDKIAEELGLTRERVRQIQEKALRVLRRKLFKQGVDREIIE